MVIPPILGEALLDLLKGLRQERLLLPRASTHSLLIVGFVAAFVILAAWFFISGCIKYREEVVSIVYFGIYCGLLRCRYHICSII